MIEFSYEHPVWALAALTYSAVGLTSIWAALGRSHWFWRITVVGAMLGLVLPIEAHELLLIFFAQATVAIVPLTMNRYFRRRSSSTDVSSGAALYRGLRPRFSLRDLMLATLAAALVFAFAAAVDVPKDAWNSASNRIFSGACMGLVTLAAVWLGLGRRRLRLRILLALVIAPFVVTFVPINSIYWTSSWFSQSLTIHVWLFGVVVAALTTAWLMLARAAGFLAIYQRGVGARPSFVAASLTLSLLILLPLAIIYYYLVTPIQIPRIVLPEPNGYDVLLELGSQISNDRTTSQIIPAYVFTAGLNLNVRSVGNVASEASLRQIVSKHAELLDDVRVALDLDCQSPDQFTPFYGSISLTDMSSFWRLAYAIRAQGQIAALENRTADATSSYLNAIQLGQAVNRGSLLWDSYLGIEIENLGQDGIFDLRREMLPRQRREVINALLSVDGNREPLADVRLRQRVWLEHFQRWRGRLESVLSALAGKVDWETDQHFKIRKSVAAQCRLLICELAILNFQTDHQQSPETLAELVPDYLPAVPQDPFSDQPLTYRRTSEGYMLYSIGWNEQDDRGKGRSIRDRIDTSGDIVLDDLYGNTNDTSAPNASTE